MRRADVKALALSAIRLYQRYLSPYKGFRCAYCAFTGRASCSALGYRAIRRFGVLHGLRLLDGRLAKCGIAYRRYHPPAGAPARNPQAGFCDLPCDLPSPSCDLPCNLDCPSPSKVWNSLADCSLPCDGCGERRSRSKKYRDQEQYVHIPPRSGRRR